MTFEPKDIVGKRVVSIATGREMGTVEQLLFEPGAHLLYGLVLKAKEKNDPELLLARSRIKAIGEDAITVETEDALTVFDADTRARGLMEVGGQLKGMRILTEDGNEIGKVDTLILSEDGAIEAYRTSTGLLGLGSGRDIPTRDVVTAGPDAIVVSSEGAAIATGEKGDAPTSSEA